MKIRTRIQINVTLTILLILALGVVLLVTNLERNLTNEKEWTVSQIVKGIAELKIITHEYLLYREQRTQMQWYARHKSLLKLLEFDENNFPTVNYLTALGLVRCIVVGMEKWPGFLVIGLCISPKVLQQDRLWL